MANIPLLATPVTVKALGAETVSTTGAMVWLGNSAPGGWWIVTITISATSGTPTLLLVLEGSSQGSSQGASGPGPGQWYELALVGADGARSFSLGSQPQPFTSTGTFLVPVSSTPLIRYRSVIAGSTPSLTYSVSMAFAVSPDRA